MAGIISVGGLATGLDTNEIIDKLVAIERRPLDLLGQQIAAAQATKASIATFAGKLAALKSASSALGTADQVLVRRASSTDPQVLEAAAGLGAGRGTTTISVTQLARGSVASATVGVAAATSAVATGPGTFEFRVGTGAVHSVAVDGTTTLQGLADAINQLGAGVTASAVNLGTADAPDFRLQLTTAASGSASTISVVRDDTALAIQTTQAGQDARFTVSGFSGTFARASNSFSDVLAGVTVSLRTLGTATVSVEDDADAIVENVQALVTAFNDLVQFVAGESTVSQDEEDGRVTLGSLATDSTVRRVLSRLHETLSASLTGATTRYVNLSSLGVATERDGTLRLDESKLRAALAADPAAAAQVLAGNGTGAGTANNLVTLIGQIVGVGGAVSTHTTSLDEQIRSLQGQIDAGQRGVDAFETNLRQQFAALEQLVSGLQSQGSFLASAFGGLR
jgi:flagellar hook-associated protein 2